MSDVIITPQNDGPYHVRGSFKIVTEGGRTIAVDGNDTWPLREPAAGGRGLLG